VSGTSVDLTQPQSRVAGDDITADDMGILQVSDTDEEKFVNYYK